jgi:hypothetical protein
VTVNSQVGPFFCLSARNNLAPTEEIFVKFYIGGGVCQASSSLLKIGQK